MSFISDIFGGDKPDYSQAQFKPYSMTSAIGSSNIDRKKNKITTTMSPEVQALFDKYLTGAGANLPTAQQLGFGSQISEAGMGIFDKYLSNLNQALGYDTQQATRDYYNQTLEGMAPQWAQEESQLADTLFKLGRTGAGTGVEGGYVNPEQFALLKARENAKLNLFLNSEDRARAIREAKIAEATGGMTNALGLFGTGVNIAPTLYGASQNILGGALQIPASLNAQTGYGLQAGQAQASAGANIANLQQQQYQSNLGFWGGLLGGAGSLYAGSQGWLKRN